MKFWRDVVLTYDGNECLVWPFARTDAGYGNLYHCGKIHLVHRITCKESHGGPPTPRHMAIHSCGNGNVGCVTKSHLKWGTQSENMVDFHRHGREGKCVSFVKII